MALICPVSPCNAVRYPYSCIRTRAADFLQDNLSIRAELRSGHCGNQREQPEGRSREFPLRLLLHILGVEPSGFVLLGYRFVAGTVAESGRVTWLTEELTSRASCGLYNYCLDA